MIFTLRRCGADLGLEVCIDWEGGFGSGSVRFGLGWVVHSSVAGLLTSDSSDVIVRYGIISIVAFPYPSI